MMRMKFPKHNAEDLSVNRNFELSPRQIVCSTSKPLEVRQGKGKGNVEYWVANVQPGRMLYEMEGVEEEVAREAFRLAAAKLPVKTTFVTRAVL